jgi:proteic killer suppression protein
MIRNFKHKGLRALYTKGTTRGIQPSQAQRIVRILTALKRARSPEYMDLPGFFLHLLEPKSAGRWAVRVSGNWRIVFAFDDGGDVIDVDLVDYH